MTNFEETSAMVAGQTSGRASRLLTARLLTGGALLAIMATSPALAQTAASAADVAASDSVIEDIVVTAQKREESIQKVPIAVTAITAEAVARSFAVDVTDVAGGIPNATIEKEALSPLASNFFIRGQGIQDREGYADSPVAVVVNGVVQGRTTAVLTDLLDIASIEVLRGPQGTLQGRNSTAGAILVRNNLPNLDKVGGSFKVLYGEHSRLDVTGVLNIPIVEGKLGFRLAGKSTNFDGFYRNLFDGKQIGGQERITLLPTLRFEEGAFDITIRGEYAKIRDDATLLPAFNVCPVALDAPGGLTAASGNNTFVRRAAITPGLGLDVARSACASEAASTRRTVNVDNFFGNANNADIRAIGAELNYEIDGAGTITYITDYRETTEFSTLDVDGTPGRFFNAKRNTTSSQQSHELRFASSFSDTVDFIAGVYVFDQSYTMVDDNQSYLFDAPPFFAVPAFTTLRDTQVGNSQDSNQFAVFGQANWHLSDALTIVTGGRYTKERKSGNICPTGVALCANRTPNVVGQSQDVSGSWSDFSPRIGVNYQASDDLFLYAYWAKGFRSGGFNLGAATAVAAGPYDPEKVSTFEAGFKADLLNRRLRVNTSAFYTKASDLQRLGVIDVSGVATASTVNAAKATFYGAEVELSALVTNALSLTASVGYLNAKYDEFCQDLNGTTPNNPSLVACGPAFGGTQPVDVSGLPLTRTPKWDMRLGATYDLSLGRFGSLLFSGDWSYTSKLNTVSNGYPTGTILGTVQYNDPNPTLNDPNGYVISPIRPATSLVNASVTWSNPDESIKVAAFMKNITKENYIGRLNPAGVFTAINLNDPQTWGFEVSFKF
jgi:iron complex outermembrane recepter protein